MLQVEQPVPPGAAPNGEMSNEVYTPPALPWTAQSGDESAASEVAEQRAKEQEIREAEEAARQHEEIEYDPECKMHLTFKVWAKN